MSELPVNRKLNQLSTCWSAVCRAHEGPSAGMATARQELLARYGGAIFRYLRGALRDTAEAEELYQEFALRFLRGDFRRAAPESGRFRDFIKTALLRLVSRHCARRRSGALPLEIDVADTSLPPSEGAEREFLRSWRAELLSRTWLTLARFEEESGRPFYQALRLRVEHPDRSCEEVATLLAACLRKSVKGPAYRQILHRARTMFAQLLLEEVTQSLSAPTRTEIEQELADLGLLAYCRPALARPDDRS
jgi:DNA-directed RNA polymerase specialized sigma24 family protein